MRPIGVLDIIDSGEPDHKILAVPTRDPRFANVNTVDDLAPHTKREIEHFFTIYKELEEKPTVMQGWRSREAAYDAIERSRAEFLRRLEPAKSNASERQ